MTRRPDTHAPRLPLDGVGTSSLPAPCQSHSATSREAARMAEPAAGTQRARVLGMLRGRGTSGATDEQIQLFLNMNPSTQRPRRIELVAAGLVADSGRTRLTRSGRSAVVWVYVPRVATA